MSLQHFLRNNLSLLQLALLAEAAVPINADRQTLAGYSSSEKARTELLAKVPELGFSVVAIKSAYAEESAGLLHREVTNPVLEASLADFFQAVAIFAKEDSSDFQLLAEFFQSPRTLTHFLPPKLTVATIRDRLEVLKHCLSGADAATRVLVTRAADELRAPLARASGETTDVTDAYIQAVLDGSSVLPAPETCVLRQPAA